MGALHKADTTAWLMTEKHKKFGAESAPGAPSGSTPEAQPARCPFLMAAELLEALAERLGHIGDDRDGTGIALCDDGL